MTCGGVNASWLESHLPPLGQGVALSWPCVTDMTGEGANNQEGDTGWDMSQMVRAPNLGAKGLTTFSNLGKGVGLRDLSVPYQYSLPTDTLGYLKMI